MVVNDSKKLPKVAQKFYCKICDYSTFKKSSFDKHLSTDKHKKRENDSKMVVNDSEKLPKVANYYKCYCGKIYKYDSGYYTHKKKCSKTNTTLTNNETTDKDELITKSITTIL
jgi:hypothetical protein